MSHRIIRTSTTLRSHLSQPSLSLELQKLTNSANPRPLPRRTRLSPARGNHVLHSSRNIRKSATSASALALVLGCCVLGGFAISLRGLEPPVKSTVSTDLEDSASVDTLQSMVDAALPGRPGNLTADQEIKLKELWAETLKVFGVASPDVDSELAHLKEEDHEQQVKTPDKKKKKRRLFSRKYKDDDGDSQTDGQSTASDDKYGQTKEFHEALADSSPEDLRKAFWSMVKHDHPDGLLLRFLRARKWDVEKALVMLISTMHWRMYETHVDDDIFKAGEGGAAEQSTSSNAATKKEGDDFLAQLRLGKSFLHGTDKEGRPMCFVRVRLHKQGEQSEASLERYTVFVIESARLLLSPPVDTAVSRPLRKSSNRLNLNRQLCLT